MSDTDKLVSDLAKSIEECARLRAALAEKDAALAAALGRVAALRGPLRDMLTAYHTLRGHNLMLSGCPLEACSIVRKALDDTATLAAEWLKRVRQAAIDDTKAAALREKARKP